MEENQMEIRAFWELLSGLEEKEDIISETSLIENGIFFKKIKRTFVSDSILYGNHPYIFPLKKDVLLARNVVSIDGKIMGVRLRDLTPLKEDEKLEMIAYMYRERLKQVELLRSLNHCSSEHLSYEELENKFLPNQLYKLTDLDSMNIPYYMNHGGFYQIHSLFFPLRDGAASLQLVMDAFYSGFILKLTDSELNELQNEAKTYEEEMETLDYVLQKNKVRGFFAKLKACN